MDQWTRPGPGGKKTRTARYGRGKRWLARWTDPSTRKERSRAFDTKDHAEAFLARLRTQLADGAWIDPRAGQSATVGEYVDRWLATKTGKAENTVVSYTGIRNGDRFRKRWDDEPVGRVTEAAVIEWLAKVRGEVSASRTRHHHVVLSGALQLAVADRKIPINPARTARGGDDGIRLPKLPERKVKRIPRGKVEGYIRGLEAHSEHAACFGLTLVFSGLRFGECAALDVDDLVGRVLQVEESIATIGGRQVPADTKSHRKRQVPLPQPVADRVRDAVGDRRVGPLLPAAKGGRWHHGTWTRIHKAACKAAGLPETTTTHDLRHTAVSEAIDAGADVKAVQKMVGHKSATLTLDTYAWLRDDKLEEVADAMESRVPRRGEPATPPAEGKPPRRLRAVR
jgi:integrase